LQFIRFDKKYSIPRGFFEFGQKGKKRKKKKVILISLIYKNNK